MLVEIKKRYSSVTGTNLKRGDKVEITKELYNKYPEEFILLETEKKPTIQKKTYTRYVKPIVKEEVEDEN